MNYYNTTHTHTRTHDTDGLRTWRYHVRAFRDDWYRNLFDDAIRIQPTCASGGRPVYRNRGICPYLYGYVWTRNAGAIESESLAYSVAERSKAGPSTGAGQVIFKYK